MIFAVGQGLATAGVAAEISPAAATAAAAAEAAANAAFFEARSSVKPEKRVFAHYMLCCGSFGSSVEAYVQDIRIAQAMGLDGFALNAGGWGDNYRESAAHMFAAAERLGTGFQLFFSADMCCNLTAADVVDMVETYGKRPNYFHRQGRPVLSTFAGEGQPPGFWPDQVLAPLRAAGFDVFFVPAFYPVTAGGRPEDEVKFWGDLVDGLFRFGPASTPFGSHSSVATNEAYARALSAAGKLFLAGYYPFYWGSRQTTVGRRYYEYQGGLGTDVQWRSIIEVQDPEWVEIVTWNDFTESYLIAPSDDLDHFYKPHLAFIALDKYYIQWFKTGALPRITKDALFYFYRTHGKDVTSAADPLGPVTRMFGHVEDALYVTVALTAPARLHVESGAARFDRDLHAGFNQVSLPFSPGPQKFELWRNGRCVAAVEGEPIAASIKHYDFFYTTGYVEAVP